MEKEEMEKRIRFLKEQHRILTQLVCHYRELCKKVAQQPCSPLYVTFQYGWEENFRSLLYQKEMNELYEKIEWNPDNFG